MGSKSRIFNPVNVRGTRHVLQAALEMGVEKVVVTSSCVTFGPSLPGQSLTEDSSNFHPFLTAYERSRYQMEHVVTAYVNQGLSVIVVNPTRVFGPGLLTEGNSVTKMIQLYLRGK